MFVDSHCHINVPELAIRLPEILATMVQNQVTHTLCVCCDLLDVPEILAMAESHSNIYASVGVHPDSENATEPSVAELVRLAQHPKVVAIGETGLDYSRLSGDLEWQRERFRNHIRASRLSGKPLIIHTRDAAKDTIRIMQEEGAGTEAGGVGGVMHCFTESQEIADAAMAMGFYISFSGIVTFKNARDLQAVARTVPLQRMLIETDSPYLAPVPKRGKVNEPGFVKYVAEFLAQLTGMPVEQIAKATTDNFFNLFKIVRPIINE
ncbi:MAG: TatD family hydrolase [Herbaspirillum sp.]